MHTVWQNIWSGLTTASPLDQANLLLGIAGVWLMIRRSLWAFPVGLAAVTVQGILFYQTHFPADATLQVYYFVLLAWGWWHWIKGKGAAPELPVTRLSPRGWAVTLAGSALATVVWAIIVGPMMHAAMPWRRAFIGVVRVGAQCVQGRKKVGNRAVVGVVRVGAVAWDARAELACTARRFA